MKNLLTDFPARARYHTRFTRGLGDLVRPSRIQMAKGLSPDERVAILPNSYDEWHDLIDKYYPSDVNPWSEDNSIANESSLGYFLYNRFLLAKSNVDTSLMSKILPMLEQALAEEHPFVFTERSEHTDLFWEQAQSSVMSIFEQSPEFTQKYTLFPWRFYYYDLGIASKSQSNRWHYDLEIPDNTFFVMIYLNDAPGFGTGIYDYHSSKIISQTHGYISTPPNYRASSLDYYHQYEGVCAPHTVDANKGDILFFCPSRCLHRGFIPTQHVNYSRKVIHITFSVLPRSEVVYPSLDPSLDPYSLSDMSRVMPVGRSFPPYWSDS